MTKRFNKYLGTSLVTLAFSLSSGAMQLQDYSQQVSQDENYEDQRDCGNSDQSSQNCGQMMDECQQKLPCFKYEKSCYPKNNDEWLVRTHTRRVRKQGVTGTRRVEETKTILETNWYKSAKENKESFVPQKPTPDTEPTQVNLLEVDQCKQGSSRLEGCTPEHKTDTTSEVIYTHTREDGTRIEQIERTTTEINYYDFDGDEYSSDEDCQDFERPEQKCVKNSKK